MKKPPDKQPRCGAWLVLRFRFRAFLCGVLLFWSAGLTQTHDLFAAGIPQIATTPSGGTWDVYRGTPFTLAASVSGDTPIAYQWTKDEAVLKSGTWNEETPATCFRLSIVQGSFAKTGRALDLATSGDAFFFKLMREDGTEVYSRPGSLKVDPDGVVRQGGMKVVAMATLAGAVEILLTENGQIVCKDAQGQSFVMGAFLFFTFENPPGLRPVAPGLYEETISSGPPYAVAPGSSSVYHTGYLRTGQERGRNGLE